VETSWALEAVDRPAADPLVFRGTTGLRDRGTPEEQGDQDRPKRLGKDMRRVISSSRVVSRNRKFNRTNPPVFLEVGALRIRQVPEAARRQELVPGRGTTWLLVLLPVDLLLVPLVRASRVTRSLEGE